MALVATLIANPSNPVLSPARAEAAAESLDASGLYWLADGIACDIVLRDGAEAGEAEARLRQSVARARSTSPCKMPKAAASDF